MLLDTKLLLIHACMAATAVRPVACIKDIPPSSITALRVGAARLHPMIVARCATLT